jgi:hypothetical protein
MTDTASKSVSYAHAQLLEGWKEELADWARFYPVNQSVVDLDSFYGSDESFYHVFDGIPVPCKA